MYNDLELYVNKLLEEYTVPNQVREFIQLIVADYIITGDPEVDAYNLEESIEQINILISTPDNLLEE